MMRGKAVVDREMNEVRVWIILAAVALLACGPSEEKSRANRVAWLGAPLHEYMAALPMSPADTVHWADGRTTVYYNGSGGQWFQTVQASPSGQIMEIVWRSGLGKTGRVHISRDLPRAIR